MRLLCELLAATLSWSQQRISTLRIRGAMRQVRQPWIFSAGISGSKSAFTHLACRSMIRQPMSRSMAANRRTCSINLISKSSAAALSSDRKYPWQVSQLNTWVFSTPSKSNRSLHRTVNLIRLRLWRSDTTRRYLWVWALWPWVQMIPNGPLFKCDWHSYWATLAEPRANKW